MQKVAFLSNINMDPLKSHLRDMGIEDSHFSGYNQHLIDLINPSSIVYNDDVEIVYMHLDAAELLKDQFYTFPDVEAAVERIDDVLNAIKTFVTRCPHKYVIISNIVFPPHLFLTFLDLNTEYSFTKVEEAMNQRITDFLKDHSNVIIYDFDRIVKLHGYKVIYDEKYWYLGRIKYSQFGFQKILEELFHLIATFRGETKKVLVLDLDNTIWGGVIGEDGCGRIQLSEDGIGRIYRDFQKMIKALTRTGVVLAINSKNNEADALEAFNNVSMMHLKWDDFVVKKINWNNKVLNMQEIAEELKVSLDSMVFIDDNAFERDLVRQHLPEVCVPEFPDDLAQLNSWFVSGVVYPYFSKLHVTKEDLKKTEHYQRYMRRKEEEYTLELSDFIEALNIKLTLHKNDLNLKIRLTQLTQKTNQFNLTTKRYTEMEVTSFIENSNSDVYGLNYEDKYGAEGTIGEAIIHREGDVAVFDTYLISCRVIGRKVEEQFFFLILDDLKTKEVRSIKANYIPTKKNMLSKDFYKRIGMHEIKPNEFQADLDEILSHRGELLSLS